MLGDVVPGHLDEQVRDRIVAETGGNPLGLREFPQAMTRAELTGGFGVPTAATVADQIEEDYRRRINALPASTRQLMLLAAADPTGDASLLWRVARTLNVGPDAATSADDAQLLEIGSSVRFHHPLVRSAAYTAASDDDRRAAHRALAGATDREIDPDRRAWHLAIAAVGPDEEAAAELERTASRAQARAGLPAAATLLQHSVALTVEPARRHRARWPPPTPTCRPARTTTALGLLAQVEADTVDDLQLARAEQLRGQIHWAASPGPEAPMALLNTAKRLEPLNVALARETYLHAWVASTYAGPLAQPGGHLVDVSRAARSTGAPDPVRPCDLLLDGLIALVLDSRKQAEPNLRRAVDAFANSAVAVDDPLQWDQLVQTASIALWDIDSYLVLSSRQVEAARRGRRAPLLSMALGGRGAALTWCGDFRAASALADERNAGQRGDRNAVGHLPRHVPLGLSGSTIGDDTARVDDRRRCGRPRRGLARSNRGWSTAVLCNGLGHYEDAAAAAEKACEETYMVLGPQVALPELIEAATRIGKSTLAEDAVERLSAMTAIRARIGLPASLPHTDEAFDE